MNDFITSEPNVDCEFKISKESCEIFQEASMTLGNGKQIRMKYARNWKNMGLNNDEITDNFNLTNEHLIYYVNQPSKVLSVVWDPNVFI